MSVQEIKEQALKLSSDDREQLAQELWESVDDRVISPEEGAEWQRRLDELVTGKVQGVTMEESMARAHKALEEIREGKKASSC